MQAKRTTRDEALCIAKPYDVLFAALAHRGVAWCSWKSNEHLAAGACGETDIDLLFRTKDRQRVTNIMYECGFILFRAPSHRSYPGIVDFINIDPETGRVLHAHAHFLLTVGEKYLKSCVLPWNEHILENRVASELSPDMFASSPEAEAVLLIAREALKIRWRDKRRMMPDELWGGKGFRAELGWLKERASAEEVKGCAEKLLNEESAALIHEMLVQGMSFERFLKMRSLIRVQALAKGWLRMGRVSALQRIWLHEALYILTRIVEKTGVLREALVRRRVLPEKGLIVAFLGPDGSGKSTVTKAIVSQWEGKLDVARIYFGTGDGAQTGLQRALNVLLSAGLNFKKTLRRKEPVRSSYEDASEVTSPENPSWTVLLISITGAFGKARQIRRVRRLSERGFLLICDRWPQNQVSGMNDGPLLSAYCEHDNRLYRFLAGWEKRQFERITAGIQPDMIIRLMPSLDMAVKRKEENVGMTEIIRQKIKAFETIHFESGVAQCSVDADQDLEKVLTSVREKIWTNLCQRPLPEITVYECVGLPGAGKTTLCKNIAKAKKFKTVDDVFSADKGVGLGGKILLTLRCMLSDPLLYVLMGRVVWDLKLWRSKEALDYLFRLPVQKHKLKIAAEKTPHLIEQLLLQNIWSSFVSGGVVTVKPEILTSFIARLYKGLDANILYFDVSVEAAANRVFQRKDGTSRFDGLEKEQLLDRLASLDSLMHDIFRAASYAGLDITYIDADAPLDAVVQDADTATQLYT